MKSLPLIATVSVAAAVGFVLAKEDGAADKAAQVEGALASAKTDNSRATGKVRPWAHKLSDIKVDDKTLYGSLPNGMRYVIQKNGLPAKRVSIRLHVDAGSLCEKESQQGVAHFLEHMVFNGTKTFPDATKLVPQMQRLGIAFGAHANAYTSFDETVYMLDLPDLEKSTVDLAFNVMGDFADGALLTDKEIDEERGVISSEKTSRDSIQSRLMQKQFKQLLPNSLLAKRFPIGTDEVIAGAPRAEFVDFYTRYYTPEKMTFIVVGDIDVAEMEQRIKDTFAGVKNPANPGAKASVGDVSQPKGMQIAVFSDNEVAETQIGLMKIEQAKPEVDTVVNRAKRIPLSIANAILNRRFSRLAKAEGATIVKGSSSKMTLFREAELGGIDITAKGENWQAAIPVLEQEMRRVIEHGFTKSEYQEVVDSMVNQYQQYVDTASTRKSKEIADELAKHVHGDFVYSTRETDLALLKQNLAKVNPAVCHQAFKKYWDTEDLSLVLTTKKQSADDEESIAAIYKRSQSVKVTAPVERKLAGFAYQSSDKLGKVVADKMVNDLGIRQITFENGVKVNIKQTDFDKNKVMMSASFGTGKAGQPVDKSGLDMLAGAVMGGGGLGKHSADDLESLLVGKNVGVGFGVEDNAFTYSGTTTPESMELQMNLLCASLMDAGYRPEAERQFKAMLPMIYGQLKHSAQGAQAKMSSYLRGGDGRWVIPKKDDAMKLTTQDVKNWIDGQLKTSALEIGIVGDMSADALIPILAKTVGALPKRDAAVQLPVENYTIDLPKAPASVVFTFDSKVKTATSFIFWKAEDSTDKNAGRGRRLSILGDILGDRMRVKLREELGDAYSPGAGAQSSTVFKNVGFVVAYSPVKTEDLDSVSTVIIELAAKLAAEGATQDELDRALTPKIGILKQSLTKNSYWLGSVVANSQTQPYTLDWARNREKDYAAITLEEINAMAKKFLTKDHALEIKITPEK